jgi:hypothetical protein
MKEENGIKKLTEYELKDLNDLQQEYGEVQNLLGQLSLREILVRQEKELIEASKEEAESTYKSTQQKERDLVDKLSKKYGEGRFNIEQGTFEPIDQEGKSISN